MLVELGHPHPVDGQVVSEIAISDDKDDAGNFVVSYIVGTTGAEVEKHMTDVLLRGATPHFGGNQVVADLVHIIQAHPEIGGDVIWANVLPGDREVDVADDVERFVSEYLSCARGKPTDVEDTHWTWDGNDRLAPGVHPAIVEG